MRKIWGPCTAQRHGSNQYAYRKLGCRCKEARDAANAAACQKRRRRRERHQLGLVSRSRWDYDVANVLRALSGQVVALTDVERWQAIDILDDRGLSARKIARRLYVNERTVVRRRAERRRVVYVLAS